MFIICVWILVLFQFHLIKSGYIETVIVTGCESCRLFLTCRHLSSVIAILEVEFSPDYVEDDTLTGANSSFTPAFRTVPPMPPRQALNQRCSGVNHCSFILTEDSQGARALGRGNITIKYACITEDRIKKYCNSEIELPGEDRKGISEGFIFNPGYPRFYAGQRECRWKIRAPPQQKIQITILDISVIVDNVLTEEDCTDVLEVRDTGQLIYSTCRQEYPPAVLVSASDTVELQLISSQAFNPRRGVLIHYTAIGCPLPPAPRDGYLVYRNDTVAEFACCVGFFFPDTGLRRRSLRCMGASWDKTLPLLDCQRFAVGPKKQKTKPKRADMASDLIAPALIIVLLFLINGGVLFYIHRIKQKQADNIRDEELGTFSIHN